MFNGCKSNYILTSKSFKILKLINELQEIKPILLSDIEKLNYRGYRRQMRSKTLKAFDIGFFR